MVERCLADPVSLRPPPEMLEDPAILRSITSTFVERMPDYMQTLDLACAAGSRPEIAAAAHKLKSAAQPVGGYEVAGLCKDLEERSGAADDPEITRLSQRIREGMGLLKESLKSVGPNQHAKRRNQLR